MIKEYQLRKLQNSYEVTLNYKGVRVRVAFTGGNVYNGAMPKLRTSDLFKMKAIEASQLFKNREVVLLRTIAESSNAKQPVVQQKKKTAKAPGTVVREKAGPHAAGTVADEEGQREPSDVGDDEKKVFENLGEAIMFIAREYHTSVQTENDARKVLKEHGVRAVIKRG